MKDQLTKWQRMRDEMSDVTEDEAWKQDMDAAGTAHIVETMLPPDQRPKLNLPHNLQTKPVIMPQDY